MVVERSSGPAGGWLNIRQIDPRARALFQSGTNRRVCLRELTSSPRPPQNHRRGSLRNLLDLLDIRRRNSFKSVTKASCQFCQSIDETFWLVQSLDFDLSSPVYKPIFCATLYHQRVLGLKMSALTRSTSLFPKRIPKTRAASSQTFLQPRWPQPQNHITTPANQVFQRSLTSSSSSVNRALTFKSQSTRRWDVAAAVRSLHSSAGTSVVAVFTDTKTAAYTAPVRQHMGIDRPEPGTGYVGICCTFRFCLTCC